MAKTPSPKILVVDDDVRLRDLLSRYLSEQGFQVTALPDSSQQAMWDSAVAAGKTARDNTRAERQKIRATLDGELAKAEPDLAAVAAAADGARNAGATVHRQVRDAWLALYGTFTPDQKTVVKNALKDKLARMDAFQQKMRERHGG